MDLRRDDGPRAVVELWRRDDRQSAQAEFTDDDRDRANAAALRVIAAIYDAISDGRMPGARSVAVDEPVALVGGRWVRLEGADAWRVMIGAFDGTGTEVPADTIDVMPAGGP